MSQAATPAIITTHDIMALQFAENGAVAMTTMKDVLSFGKILLQSGLVPDGFKTVEQVAIALQYVKELGLPPGLASIRQVAVIKGRPCIWGDLPLALVQRSQTLVSIEEYYFDEAGARISPANMNLHKPVFGAYCKAVRKGQEATPFEDYFTMADAKKAGLSGSVWSSYPRDMLKARTRARVLKSGWADVLSGVGIAEYDHGTIPGMRDEVAVVKDSPVNEKFQAIEPEVVNEELEELKGYVFKAGKFEGVAMADVPISQLSEFLVKVRDHLAKSPEDEMAQEIFEKISAYLGASI